MFRFFSKSEAAMAAFGAGLAVVELQRRSSKKELEEHLRKIREEQREKDSQQPKIGLKRTYTD